MHLVFAVVNVLPVVVGFGKKPSRIISYHDVLVARRPPYGVGRGLGVPTRRSGARSGAWGAFQMFDCVGQGNRRVI